MKKWTLKQTISALKKAFPNCKPVTISIRNLKDQGSCNDTPARVYISINKSLKLREQKEVLLHEWAHGLVGWEDEPHTPEWGQTYAELCRWWYKADV